MAGYKGYSMSNNAVEAYENGEKPLSRWTKSDILDAANEVAPDMFDRLKKVRLADLKRLALKQSSWHHTSSHFNRTDFYELDIAFLENVTIEQIDRLIERSAPEQKPQPERWLCEYLEWSGTRKHPKATEHQDVGEIIGNWFHLPDGRKKSVNARGFCRIKKQ